MGILRTNEISGLETPTPVTGSLLFDGDGDYLKLASNGDFGYSTGDFTWELWINFGDVSSGNYYILDHGSDGGSISYNSNNLKYYNSTVGGSSVLYTTGWGSNFTPNTWYHFAAVRKNGVTSLYTNGILSVSASDAHNYSAQAISIATYGGTTSGSSSYDFTGYISNLRILKGTALYTSDFTPPVHELQPIGDTVLLCCNNPDSAGAEATGKTITVNGNAAASTFSPGLTRDFTFGTQFQGVAKFDTQGYFVPPSGTTEQRGRGRGVFGGGGAPTAVNTIDYIQIQSMGNAIDFGDLTTSVRIGASCSSETRGLFVGGFSDPATSTAIQYINLASTGNSLTFGSLSDGTYSNSGVSNSTRGVIAGGVNSTPYSDGIAYVTIASTGSAQTFGTLSAGRRMAAPNGVSSPTRGIWIGGQNPSPGATNIMEYITIASTGSAQTFGELNSSVGRYGIGSCSNSIRGVFGGGYEPTANINTIEYIIIASIGNAQDFGDLTQTKRNTAAVASPIRGVWGGGGPTNVNVIESVTIASTGNAQDFGDLTQARQTSGSCSDSHGGLS